MRQFRFHSYKEQMTFIGCVDLSNNTNFKECSSETHFIYSNMILKNIQGNKQIVNIELKSGQAFETTLENNTENLFIHILFREVNMNWTIYHVEYLK